MTEENHRFVRNQDYIFRRIVDELVLVPIHQELADMDSILVLNEVGAFIWEQLMQPMGMAELMAAILDEFEADEEAITTDVEQFLQEMTEFGAVTRS